MIDKSADTSAYKVHPVLRAFANEMIVRDADLLETTRQRYHRIVVTRAKQSYEASPERWTAPDDLYAHLARVLPTLSQTLEQRATTAEQPPLSFTDLADPDPPDRAPYAMLREHAADDIGLGMELADTFKQAVNRSKWGPVGTQLLKLGLVCARAADDRDVEAAYLGRLGTQHSTRRPERAGAYFDAAVQLAKEIDGPSLGGILTAYAEFCRIVDSRRALSLAKEALTVNHEAGEERLLAETRMVIGEIHWRESRLDDAQAEYARARAFLERTNDGQGLADLLNKLASVEFNRGGRYEQAIELFQEALRRHEALQDDVMRAEDLNDLGAAYRYLDRFEDAERCFREALELNKRIGNRRLQAFNICNIAGALYGQGQYDLAQQHAEQGRQLGEDVRDKVPQLWGLVWEGLAWRGMVEPDRAERRLRDAVELGRTFDNPRDLAGALARLGALLAEDLDEPDEALVMIDEAIDLLQRFNLATTFSNVTLADLLAQRDALVASRRST
jgi:tetratricopeptide (TPR) repeat protein